MYKKVFYQSHKNTIFYLNLVQRTRFYAVNLIETIFIPKFQFCVQKWIFEYYCPYFCFYGFGFCYHKIKPHQCWVELINSEIRSGRTWQNRSSNFPTQFDLALNHINLSRMLCYTPRDCPYFFNQIGFSVFVLACYSMLLLLKHKLRHRFFLKRRFFAFAYTLKSADFVKN